MLTTTLAALILQALKYLKNNNIVLLAITAVLLILAIFMVIEVIKVFVRRKDA